MSIYLLYLKPLINTTMKLHQLFESTDQELLQALETNVVVTLDAFPNKVYRITDIPKITPQQFKQLLIKSFGSIEKAWPADDYGPLMISHDSNDCCICYDDIVGYGDVDIFNVKWSRIVEIVNDFADKHNYYDDDDDDDFED